MSDSGLCDLKNQACCCGGGRGKDLEHFFRNSAPCGCQAKAGLPWFTFQNSAGEESCSSPQHLLLSDWGSSILELLRPKPLLSVSPLGALITF
jgi:hypothetical protein